MEPVNLNLPTVNEKKEQPKRFKVFYVRQKSSPWPDKDMIEVVASNEDEARKTARNELKKQGKKHVHFERVEEKDSPVFKGDGIDLGNADVRLISVIRPPLSTAYFKVRMELYFPATVSTLILITPLLKKQEVLDRFKITPEQFEKFLEK